MTFVLPTQGKPIEVFDWIKSDFLVDIYHWKAHFTRNISIHMQTHSNMLTFEHLCDRYSWYTAHFILHKNQSLSLPILQLLPLYPRWHPPSRHVPWTWLHGKLSFLQWQTPKHWLPNVPVVHATRYVALKRKFEKYWSLSSYLFLRRI
jgi:hypothetical protein